MHMVTRWNFTFDVLRGPDEHGEAVQAVHCASDISGFRLTEEVACNGKSHLPLRYLLKLNVLIEVFFQDWKYFGAISYPLSSNSTVKVQEKHKNIWFTAVTKKDVVLLLVVRNVRGAIQSPW